MKRRSSVILLAVLLLSFAFLQVLPAKVCCVAGKYEGFQLHYAKPNCPPPVKQAFTMVIKQLKPCAAAIGGTVTDSSGVVSNWTGTLSLGLRRCCRLEGSFITPSGNTVKFRGTICLKLGKWQAKGTWEEIGSTDPCKGSGTWEMTHI
ncbi:MAG: hypothetical protein JXO51_02100 [Candidatus Aminicenantes bacterium]|nr:hypothetical protein [Candidatus Aminicenantes bacterium]